ncbi:hypothetical protein NPIL_89141 [Nephila pilipes]|uniref:Uncharacterized protein n=1 Tax=Nephila pilipes TaxID=299642 RepID=A0A8X6NMQ8_NEPPI|nr:hypothetical protein NPIL_89141 [Nephila pilipes]
MDDNVRKSSEEEFYLVFLLLINLIDRKCLVDLADQTATVRSAAAVLQPPSAHPAANATLADAANGTRSVTAAIANAAVRPSANEAGLIIEMRSILRNSKMHLEY